MPSINPNATASNSLDRQTHPVLNSNYGFGLTIVLLVSWSSTLWLLLHAATDQVAGIWIGLAILGRTFLHTGLFITAHDAMHQNLIPQHKQLNHTIGRICVTLYAFLSYRQCRINHGKHHQIPAQVGDPDFHDGQHSHPIQWYFQFLSGYLSIRGFSLFTLVWLSIFLLCYYIFHIMLLNILLFWIIPFILSSTQLFVFGTYLPHRSATLAPATPGNPVRSLWSLLSCYHFGEYHWEHHNHPKTPWYQLPQHSQPAIYSP